MDAAERLERVDKVHRGLSRIGKVAHVELYERCSSSIRVTRDSSNSTCEVARGEEAGVAVRVRSSGERGLRFSALSGDARTNAERCVRLALTSAPLAGEPRSTPGRAMADHDPLTGDASVDTLTTWLAQAWTRVTDLDALKARGLEPGTAWVEAATTTESWVDGDGLRASRVRRRAWAMLLAKHRRLSSSAKHVVRPILVAARRWPDLDPGSWAVGLSERLGGSPRRARQIPERPLFLFAHGPAADLVQALARRLHVASPPVHWEVGPGWCIADDPIAPGALFGGAFDDAGCPTMRTSLADGCQITGSVGGEGHLRRASFRDPPRPFPSSISVAPPQAGPDRTGVKIASLVLHVFPGDLWVLEVDGSLIEGSTPGPRLGRRFVRTTPEELVRGCLGGSGACRSSYKGVATPALWFEGLRFSE